jgi:hypothetical protein
LNPRPPTYQETLIFTILVRIIKIIVGLKSELVSRLTNNNVLLVALFLNICYITLERNALSLIVPQRIEEKMCQIEAEFRRLTVF